MIELSPDRQRELRAAAHHLKPVVSISQKGLTASVLAEIDRSLKAHELIKLRLYHAEREVRDALLGEICSSLDCAPVQHIGNLLVLWRPRPEGSDDADAAKPRRPRKPLTKKQAAAQTEARNRRR